MSLNAGGDWMIHTERANRPRACVADAASFTSTGAASCQEGRPSSRALCCASCYAGGRGDETLTASGRGRLRASSQTLYGIDLAAGVCENGKAGVVQRDGRIV